MKKISIIPLLAIAIFTSCEKEAIPEENNESIEDLNIVVKTVMEEHVNSRGAVIKSTAAYNQDVMNLGLGVCWSTSVNPTIENDKSQGYITFSNADNDIQGIANSGDSIDFSTIASGLLPNTQYFIRAYVTTGNGTAYGNQDVFTTLPNNNQEGTVTDMDGNSYKTVKIGNQEWMTGNLRTSKFANGDDIPNITDSAEWANADSSAFCWRNNNPIEDTITGKIYNWYAVNDSRELCPTGWHVANKSDWDELLDYVANNGFEDREYEALKGNESDDSGYFGFTPSKGSARYGSNPQGSEFCNTAGSWWSIEENDSTKNGKHFSMQTNFFGNLSFYEASFNVRCVKESK